MSAPSPKGRQLRVVRPGEERGMSPPVDVDAERVVLGDLMDIERAGYRIAQIREYLRPEHFALAPHQQIFEAICDIDEHNVRPDLALVQTWLNERKRFKGDFGPAVVREIALTTPSVVNIDAHVMAVLRLAQRREMIEVAREISAEGYGDVGDTDEWLRSCVLRITKVADQFDQAEAVTGGRSAATAVQKMLNHVERRGRIVGTTTGIGPIDEVTAGLHPTDVTLLSAVSGGGKTALAMNVALNVARAPDDDGERRNGVLVFSIEMPHDQLGARMVASLARVDMNDMRKGRVSEADIRRSVEAVQEINELPIQIDDSKHVTPGVLRARARRAAEVFEGKGCKLVLIVIDYVQLINGRESVERGATRERELAEVAREVVKLAAELRVAILLLAQLNSDGEIRESRAIHHYAHNWWDLERAPKDKQEFARPEPVKLHIRKHRNGPAPFEAELWFHRRFVLFTETD